MSILKIAINIQAEAEWAAGKSVQRIRKKRHKIYSAQTDFPAAPICP
jgi:hypothetical protein